MEESDLSEKFISFEKKNRLFELRDSNNTPIWDIIRFDIYVNLMWDYAASPVKKKNYGDTIKFAFLKLKTLLNYWRDKKEYENFFYLCSRNKINNKLFDQSSYAVVKFFERSKSFLFESNTYAEQEFLFKEAVHNFPQFIHRKTYKVDSIFDYSEIVNLITEEFGNSRFNSLELKQFVNNFYSDYDFFTKLFTKKKVKRIFVTQNGMQKGLFAAANNMNIPSFEFQHGIVDKGHLAYYYPNINLSREQSYLPGKIFSLSSFWFKDLHIPNASIFALGNDYFAKVIPALDEKANALTIISADVFGLALEEFLLSNVKQPIIANRSIFFKLHPNQFNDKKYYQDKFAEWKNISVISNEYSVSELLEKSNALLTIQSTAVYEALQAGRKVILLKQSTYRRHAELFSNPNLYLVDNSEELHNAMSAPVAEAANEIVFFAPYDPQILNEALKD